MSGILSIIWVAGQMSARPEILFLYSKANARAIAPPRECPTIKGFSICSLSINSDTILACSCKVALSDFNLLDQPQPALSIAITRYSLSSLPTKA